MHTKPTKHSKRNEEIGEWQIRIMASIAKELHQHRYNVQVSTGSTSKMIGSSLASLKLWFDELAHLDFQELAGHQGLPRITSGASTWLITANMLHARQARQMPNVRPVILVTGDSPSTEYCPRMSTLNIDKPGLSPFQQLYFNSRTSHVAKQAG